MSKICCLAERAVEILESGWLPSLWTLRSTFIQI